jgi:hypothetical protein
MVLPALLTVQAEPAIFCFNLLPVAKNFLGVKFCAQNCGNSYVYFLNSEQASIKGKCF